MWKRCSWTFQLTLGSSGDWESDKDATLFIYIVEGAGYFDTEAQTLIDQRKAVLMNKGEEFFAQATEKGLRFLLFSGQPIEEPIAWGGPIVMNTHQELQQAFQEIENGTFIK